jgi:excisionase family DNA binding protein
MFTYLEDELSTSEAATRLKTTVPTIVKLIRDGELIAREEARGTRFRWRVSAASVEAFRNVHGTFPRKRKRRTDRLGKLESEIAALRSRVAELAAGALGADPREIGGRERDDLRARVVVLTDAWARARSAAELRDRAEEERAAMVRHLTEALAAGERADDLRREALRELEEAVAAAAQPGHSGPLET